MFNIQGIMDLHTKVAVLYSVSALLYLFGSIRRIVRNELDARYKVLDRVTTGILVLGFILHTIMELWVWTEYGRPPYRTFAEAFILMAWSTVLIWLIVQLLYRANLVGFLAIGGALFGMYYWAIAPERAQRLVPPALNSPWFAPHVAVYITSYAAGFLAFCYAIAALVAHYLGSKWTKFLADMSHRLVCIGFPLLTGGIVMGAMWAQTAWGTYWGWDPKETWALVTWLFYGVYLHSRYTPNFRMPRPAWTLVLGFFVILTAYMGVNHLPSAKQSLHTFEVDQSD